MKIYGKVAHFSLAYAMNDEFSRVLHQQMEYFSRNPSADTLNRVQGEVSEVFQSSFYSLYLKMARILRQVFSTVRRWFGKVMGIDSYHYHRSKRD